MSSYAGDCSVLVLLDLSSAFDTVDHNILIERHIRHSVGVVFIIPQKQKFYCLGGRICVKHLSNVLWGTAGLGPGSSIFSLLPLGQIIKNYNVAYHLYADDIQLHVSLKTQ